MTQTRTSFAINLCLGKDRIWIIYIQEPFYNLTTYSPNMSLPSDMYNFLTVSKLYDVANCSFQLFPVTITTDWLLFTIRTNVRPLFLSKFSVFNNHYPSVNFRLRGFFTFSGIFTLSSGWKFFRSLRYWRIVCILRPRISQMLSALWSLLVSCSTWSYAFM